MTEWSCPSKRTPPPGVIKFTTLVDSSLIIITIHLVSMNHAPEKRRKVLKKYINFKFFTPKLPPLGVGVMKFTISCHLTLQLLHTKLGWDWPSSFWEEDFNARRTPTCSNRSPEWLMWPKNFTRSGTEPRVHHKHWAIWAKARVSNWLIVSN